MRWNGGKEIAEPCRTVIPMFYVHEDHLANLSKHRFWCNYSWVGTEIFLTRRRHHALKSIFIDLHYITLYCLSKCYGLAHRSVALSRPELLLCTQGNWAIHWDTKYTFQIKIYQFAFYSSGRTFLSWGCRLTEEWLVPILLWNIFLGGGDRVGYRPPCAVDIESKRMIYQVMGGGGSGGDAVLDRLCWGFSSMLVCALGGRHPELSGIVLQWASYFPFLPLKHGMKLSFPVLLNTTFFLIQEKSKNFIVQLKIHNQTFELNLSLTNLKIIYINLRGKIQQNKASIPM